MQARIAQLEAQVVELTSNLQASKTHIQFLELQLAKQRSHLGSFRISSYEIQKQINQELKLIQSFFVIQPTNCDLKLTTAKVQIKTAKGFQNYQKQLSRACYPHNVTYTAIKDLNYIISSERVHKNINSMASFMFGFNQNAQKFGSVQLLKKINKQIRLHSYCLQFNDFMYDKGTQQFYAFKKYIGIFTYFPFKQLYRKLFSLFVQILNAQKLQKIKNSKVKDFKNILHEFTNSVITKRIFPQLTKMVLPLIGRLIQGLPIQLKFQANAIDYCIQLHNSRQLYLSQGMFYFDLTSLNNLQILISMILLDKKLVVIHPHLPTLTGFVLYLIDLVHPLILTTINFASLSSDLFDLLLSPSPYIYGINADNKLAESLNYFIQNSQQEIEDLQYYDLQKDKIFGRQKKVFPLFSLASLQQLHRSAKDEQSKIKFLNALNKLIIKQFQIEKINKLPHNLQLALKEYKDLLLSKKNKEFMREYVQTMTFQNFRQLRDQITEYTCK